MVSNKKTKQCIKAGLEKVPSMSFLLSDSDDTISYNSSKDLDLLEVPLSKKISNRTRSKKVRVF